jgi:PAS domain S-box-containing protein
MDFTAPQNNAFRYMLEGFDRDWVEVTDVHQATYTNLPAGNYWFKVLGSNNDGVWSDEALTIDVSVSPPIWATWWAYTIYFLLAAALLYRFQRAQAERLKREAEQKYNERLQLYFESLEKAPDCVLIADANQQLMYANTAINVLLGIDSASARGQSMMNLLFSSDRDAANATVGLTTDGLWHGEVNNQRAEEKYAAEMTLATVTDTDDNTIAYVGIARDITNRKTTEIELAKYRRNLEKLVDERTEDLSREVTEHKEARETLASSLDEKELLLKELHHRVKNNMQVISSLLNIQSETVDDARFTSLLNESQQRIRSMELIHENLFQSESLLEINFQNYIQMLAHSVCRLYTIPGVTIQLDLDVDDLTLDIDTAVPCGLIINELISNSLKHAFYGHVGTGVIAVSFKRVDSCYELSICDDGIGMPDDFDFDNSLSMGLEIVSILTEKLEGTIKHSGGKGSTFRIRFPGQ